MEQRPDAPAYKPTVNIEQAPRMAVPFLYVLSAYGFLVAAAIFVIRESHWLAFGIWGNPMVILTVHLLTVGFLSMTAMGVLSQWIPVVFDVDALSLKRATIVFLGYLLGILGFVVSLSAQRWSLLAASASLLALVIIVWSGLVIRQLNSSAKPRDSVYLGIVAAVIGFNLVWIFGVFMALSFLGWWPEFAVLPVHIATALVGWLGLLVLSIQQKLNPMFSMSRAEGIRLGLPIYPAMAGVLAAWLSLAVGQIALRIGAGLWVLAAIISVVQSIRVIRQGKAKAFDPVFLGVGAAWMLLTAGAVMAAWLNPLAVLLAFWGLFTLIFSYQSRIFPFIVAVAVARRLPGPIYKAFFMAQAMHAKKQPLAVGLLGIVGALFMMVGRIQHQPFWMAMSGGVALLMVLSQITNLTMAMVQGRKKAPQRP